MFFHVGPHKYSLVISDRAIFDQDGNQLEGLAVEQRRLLIISFRVAPDRREEIALHELAHAYLFHFPPPRTDEERCQFFATTAQHFRMDLEAQGGAEALREMTPQRVPHLSRPPEAGPIGEPPSAAKRDTLGTMDRIECGCCGADIMCGEIRSAAPVLDDYLGKFRMERWCECEACGTVQIWWEYCSPTGTASGTFVSNPPPKLLRGKDAAQWLAERGLRSA